MCAVSHLAIFPKFRFQCCLRGRRIVIRADNSGEFQRTPTNCDELWQTLACATLGFEWCLWISGARVRQSSPGIASDRQRSPPVVRRREFAARVRRQGRQCSPELAGVRQGSPRSPDDTIARTDDQQKADTRIVRETDRHATTTMDGTMMGVVREVSVHTKCLSEDLAMSAPSDPVP